MAPTGAMIQMYGAQHAQGVQKQAPQPSTPMGSAPVCISTQVIRNGNFSSVKSTTIYQMCS